jgi:hypothetical protein
MHYILPRAQPLTEALMEMWTRITEVNRVDTSNGGH